MRKSKHPNFSSVNHTFAPKKTIYIWLQNFSVNHLMMNTLEVLGELTSTDFLTKWLLLHDFGTQPGLPCIMMYTVFY